MSTTHRIQTWVDTGTGRQAAGEISVEVAGGSIVGDAAGVAGSAIEVRSEAASLAVNDLVYISGWSETHARHLVTKADANASGKQAQFVCRSAFAQNSNGLVYTAFRTAADVNTNAVTTAGDPVYLSETAGGWTETAPTGVNSTAQVVGHCAIKSATVGVIEFDLRDFPTINRSDLQADLIDGTKIADDAVDSEHYAAASIDNEHLADNAVDSAELAAGSVDDAHLAGLVTRAKLLEEALAVYGIPATALKSDAGAALTAAETASTFNVAVAANVISVQGEICDNETEVSTGVFQFVLPPEYVAAGDVKVRVKTALIKTGAAVNNASTIDVEAYEQTGNGAVGADLCETAAQSWAADDTWYTKDFVVTATGLVAGDILNVKIVTSVVDSEAGAGTLRANLDGIAVLLDIKG